jgi:ribosomal protein L11 methyltransferase
MEQAMPTRWKQLTMVVDADQVERLSTMLEMFLAQAVTSTNAGADEFYEVAFPGTPDWQKVAVTALFDSSVELDPILDFIHTNLGGEKGEEIPASVAQLVDQDWQRVWLKSFQPIKVGHNLWVCPSWCDPVEPEQRNIILDPGLAFGTGTHATTHMCLQWLSEQSLQKKDVLDYGSGSGILAIAALLSGAEHADAVDIDPLAVQACKENAERNQMAHKMDCLLPENLIGKQYDLVIVNILADVIIELRDTLLLHLKLGGILLLTGILDSQAKRVSNAFGDQYTFVKYNSDQWCLLVANG